MDYMRVVALSKDSIIPTRTYTTDAGYDLYSMVKFTLWPGEIATVGTGIAVDIPRGYVGLVHPRSGLAAKCGVTVLNAPGTIDSGYHGEVKVILVNHSKDPVLFAYGDRIAQLLIQKIETPVLIETESFNSVTDRGMGGFGSSGR